MRIEFDPIKSNRNASERGLPFDRVIDLDWESALVSEDDRFAYPERRFVALGFIEERLHVLCFTPVEGGIRVISFRKATNERRVTMNKKPLTDETGEVRELEAEDIRAMRPAIDAVPGDLAAMFPKRRPGQRGPQKAPVKQSVTLRLDRDVLDRFRATGDGWQSRINEALRKADSQEGAK